MNKEQRELVVKADESLKAAKTLFDEGYYDFAASRAYYSMFYVAEAFLLEKGLAFSKHSGVHSAFGLHFVKTGIVPVEFHEYLIHGMQVITVLLLPCPKKSPLNKLGGRACLLNLPRKCWINSRPTKYHQAKPSHILPALVL